MKYLSLPALMILLCLNVCADEGIVRGHQESSDTLHLMTKHQVLDEIERLKNEIDQLTSAGHISSSVALSASAILATIAYGVTLTNLSYLFLPDNDGPTLRRYVIATFLSSLFPGAGLGALLSYKNTEPYIPPSETLWTSFKASIASSGLLMLGIGILSILNKLEGGDFLELDANIVLFSTIVTIPFHTYMLYQNMMYHLEGGKQKVFDLEFRLKEARNHLRKFEDLSFKNQAPDISP